MKKLSYSLLLFSLGIAASLHAQIEGITQRPFGKNRVQFKDYGWRFKTSPNLEFYYYEYGSRLSDFAILYAEEEFNRIADLIGYSPTQKIRLFIYNSVTDLMQSNVGLNTELLALGGQTNFVRPIVEVPFKGSLLDFKQEISQGIAWVLLNEMMYGTGFREMLQAAQIFNLPEWYLGGMAAYAAQGWSQQMDDYMRNAIQSRKIRHPNRTTGKDAVLVGQSFWNFIVQRYGEQQVASILNLTRITRDEELAIQNTLGRPFSQLVKEWRDFYREISRQADTDYDGIHYDRLINGNRNNKYTLYQLKLSPDGRYLAYTLNERGRYRVVVRNMQKKRKRMVIRRGGYRVFTQRFNEQLPLIAWSDNYKLGVAYMRNGKSRIEVFHLSKKRGKKRPVYAQTFEYFNQIVGFDISADASHFAISGDRRGIANIESAVNDVYIYNTREQFLKKITPSDLWDDRDPVFVGTSNDIIIFSSNRPNDSINLPPATYKDLIDDYNLYLYNPKISEERLTQLTFSSAQETQPECHDLQYVYFLSNENGINNLFRINLQSGQQEVLTNLRQDLRAFSYARGQLAFRYFGTRKLKERYVLERNVELSAKTLGPDTPRLQYLRRKGYRKTQESPPPPKEVDKPEAAEAPSEEPDTVAYDPEQWSLDDYVFDPAIVKEVKKQTQQASQTQVINLVQRARQAKRDITIRGVFPYEPRFTAAQTVTAPIVDPLRGFGLLFEVRLADMLENHNFHAGILGITDLRSSNYFAEYSYLARRIDVGVRYDRKSIFIASSDLIHRYSSNQMVARFALPFTNAFRVEAFAGYLNTRFTDVGVLSNPDVQDHYIHLRGRIVLDNTVSAGMNMLRGSRAMVSYEQNLGMAGAIDKSFDKLFVDLRHYLPIDREIVFATRFSYGYFGGRAPKRFMLGGMDNWLNPRTDGGGLGGNPLAVQPGVGNLDLLFHEFATHLRGFNFNHIAGRQYFVLNAELRVPLVQYIFRETVKSRFFRNIQLATFYDIGTAWNEKGPWERQNDINTYIVRDGETFEVIVRNYRNPYLMGFGWGARTYLLGYYIKLDAAWAVDDFIVARRPRYYITIGYDF